MLALLLIVYVCAGNGSTVAFAASTSSDTITESVLAENNEITGESDKTNSKLQPGDESTEGSNALDIDAIEKVVCLFEILPAPSVLEDMAAEEIDEVMWRTQGAMDAFDALNYAGCDYIIENYLELYNVVSGELCGYLAVLMQDEVGLMSLLPLDEVEVYLVLNEKTVDELKAMSLDKVLSILQDSNGNNISVWPTDATTVWKYVRDEINNLESYEKYSIGSGATIDLSAAQNVRNYHLELIVGSENQLEKNNVRYVITVYITGTIQESLEYELYLQDLYGIRSKVNPERTVSAVNTQLYEITVNEYVVSEPMTGGQYYLA